MEYSEVIKVDFAGESLHGRISHRTGSDITVTMIKPYPDLAISSHIPYFARASRNFLAEYGIQTAQQLLIELYQENQR